MFKLHKTAVYCILAFLAGASSYAGEQITITLDKACESAVASNISIKKEAVSLNSSKRDYNHLWNNFLPTVSASVAQTKNGETNSSNLTSESLNAGISASLSLSASLPSKIALLKAQYDSGKADYEDTVRNTEVEVKKAFYSLLYAQENVEVYKSSLTSCQNQYDQTKVKKERGFVPELDLLSAQVNLESAKLNLKNAEKSFFNALLEFLNTTGIEINPENTYVLEGSLDDADKVLEGDHTIPSPEKVEEIINNSPSVRSVNDSLKIAKLSRNSTLSQSYLPSLSLSASVYPYSRTDTYNPDTTVNSDNNWSTSIGISIPLDGVVPGSSKWDSVQSGNDEIKKLELELDNTVSSVKTQALEKIHDIEISLSTLNARKLNVELAKKTYEMTEEAYSKGTKDLLSLQTSLDSYHSAVLQWRSEQYNLISYVLDLENLLGLSGTAGL